MKQILACSFGVVAVVFVVVAADKMSMRLMLVAIAFALLALVMLVWTFFNKEKKESSYHRPWAWFE